MEFAAFKQFRQVIIWGFPLHTHTHSYIHGAWVKTFQYLGMTTHWFHDGEYPSPTTFDYSRSLFITEGWADEHIPVNASSTYFVHIARNPAKYLDAGARLIEIRYNVLEIHDFNYDYKLPTTAFALSQDTLYEVVEDDRAVAGRRGRMVRAQPYEAVYMYWATDLLPHEIRLEDAAAERLPVIFYIGSMDEKHPFQDFKHACEAANLAVVQIDPWRTPVSYEENITLMKASFCAPDFRSHGSSEKAREYGKMNGTNHLDIGYIPCRVFKAISYGQSGITNSQRVKALLGDHVEYVTDPAAVLTVVSRRAADVEWRQAAMRHVAERHTFLQRARDLARALMMRSATPVVTAMYDIGRAAVDGRSIETYKTWMLRTLRSIQEPMVLYLDNRLADAGWEKEVLEARQEIGPICVMTTALEEIPMWSSYDSVASVLQAKAYKHLHPNDITNKHPAYSLIQYSKFEWLSNAAKRIPLCDHLVWMDAGFSRFFTGDCRFQLRKKMLNVLPQNQISIEASALISQIGMITPENYIGSNLCILHGGLWVVSKSLLPTLLSRIQKIWLNEMLEKGRIDNEQIALALVCKDSPEFFDLVYTNQLLGSHRTMFFNWFSPVNE